MRLGKNMRKALEFAVNNPGCHAFNYKCRATRNAIKALSDKKLIITYQFKMFGAVDRHRALAALKQTA